MPSPPGYVLERSDCLYCRVEYDQTVYNKKFCSRECFTEAYKKGRRSELRACDNCGKMFEARSDTSTRSCSASCRGILGSESRKTYSITCEQCGEVFTSRYEKSRLCSGKCKNAEAFAKRDGDPKKYLSVLLSSGKTDRRGDRKNLGVDFLLDLLDKQDGRCAITGTKLTFSSSLGQGRVATNASIDRIDSSRGYEKDNVQLVCDVVNRMKLDMSVDELVSWCKKIVGNSNG